MSSAVDVAIRDAQTQLRAARESRVQRRRRFVATLPSRVHTSCACTTRTGERGFAPIDLPGATLAARVLSLLLAHYLTRPNEFLPHRLLEERNGVAEGDLVVRVLP